MGIFMSLKVLHNPQKVNWEAIRNNLPADLLVSIPQIGHIIMNTKNKEDDFSMNKMAMTALGLGAAYLMRNKGARDKLMKQVESFTGPMKNGSQKNS